MLKLDPSTPTSTSATTIVDEYTMPFVLCANVNFVPGKYDEWQAAYDHLGKHVWNNELTTRSYYFGLPIEHTFDHSSAVKMFAFEMYDTTHLQALANGSSYDNKDGLYETHLKSPAMEKFLSAVPPTMTTGLDLQGYEDKGGFLDRYADRRECEVMVDLRILCQPGTRADIVNKLVKLADNITDLAGTYTFLVLQSLDNENGVRVFQRFETWKAKSQHESHPSVLDFWHSSKESIASMEAQSYVPNRKGWLHRGGLSKL